MGATSTSGAQSGTKHVESDRGSIVVDGELHRAAKLTALQLGLTLGGYVSQLVQADIAKRSATRARR